MNNFIARAFLAVVTALLLTGTGLAQRQMERLGRGIITIKSSSTQVYVGWRLLGNDPTDIAFNLYRSANGATAVKVNSTPLTATTDYLDTPGSLSSTAYTYSVKTVLGGVEVADTWANPLSGPVTLPANAPTRQYIPVPMQPTPDDAAAGVSFDVKFCWVGDFDGDGEYDFLVDRTNPTVEARQWLQAYKRDGTLLWQMNMGPNSVDHYNITPGSSSIGIGHGDNVTVYDMDGDGKAEVIARTANGVVFPNGTTLVAPDNEVQYISILDGLTGLEKTQTSGVNSGSPARAVIPIPASWATKTHMNGQMGIVYADGIRPTLFFHPSNRNADQSFNKMALTWDYRNGALTQRWIWLNGGHTAEGHQVRFADVDNDGKDEYCDVGNVVKADGSGQINENVLTEVVHGDRFHIADIDPDRPGLETFLIQQNNSTGLATAYHSADKSAVIKKGYASGVVDVGRGTIGSFVPSLQGLQYFSTQPGVFDCKANQVYASGPFPPETIWWDGDLGREFVSTIGSSATSPGIDKFNTSDGSTGRVLSLYSDAAAPGYPYNNYIAYGGRPQFWGDILGDWREELICAASDNSELRIYTTKTVDTAKTGGGVPFRIYTLMHNPQYRDQATTKGYVQSSYVDYYLGYNMTPPPPPPMVDAKLVWRGGTGTTTWDSGTTSSWLNSGANSSFTSGDSVRFDISSNSTTAVVLSGTLQPSAMTVYSPSNSTFDGSAGSLAGTMKLMKAGAGAMTLSGTHSFTGTTTVWDGALLVNGGLQQSPVTVWGGTWGGALAAGATGGRIGGVGVFSKAVSLKYRGAITPGNGMGSAGTLALGAGLTAEDGSVLALDLSNDPNGLTTPSDRIAVTGNLALSGKVKVIVKPLNGQLAAGTYTLLTYTGSLTGSLANLDASLPVGVPYTLAVGNGAITLTVAATRAAGAVVWKGSGNWDLATTQNWLRAGSADVFVAGDTLTFDAGGSASPNVALVGGLPVAGVTVNASTDYTFSGSGYISGSGGLTKSGSGTLTVSTLNDFTGATTINGGVLAVSSLGDAGVASALGAATSDLVIDGGTLRLTGLQANTNRGVTLGASGGTLEVALASSSLQTSGVVTGAGKLTKSGPGTLIFASANTYSGGTTISGGTIYLAGKTPNVSGLGTGPVTLNNGTLSMADVQASETGAWNLVVPSGSTGRLNADGRCSLSGTLTGGGDFTFYTPYIRTELYGNWSAFTGRIYVISDSDGGDFRMRGNGGYPLAQLDIGNGVYAYYNVSYGATIKIGSLSGASGARLLGGSGTVIYEVGARNESSEFAGVVGNSSGSTALTKVGTGTLTLSGANTYTGATTVSAGKLSVSGSLAATATTVATTGKLGGTGSIAGSVVCSGSLAPGIAAAGTLTLANGLTLASTSTLDYDLGTTSDTAAVTGNLTLDGIVNVTASAGFAAGTYTLATYSGTLTNNTLNVGTVPSGYTATVNTATAGQVNLVVADLNAPQMASGPSVSTNPIIAVSTNLSVTATDNGGEGNLTYAWSATGPSAVAYSANGTNAAKSTNATFSAAGAYTFTVTATDLDGYSLSRSVSVTVVATPTSLTVTPASASVVLGTTAAFSAVVSDQFGAPISNPSVSWSTTRGGTISSGGLYTATAIGGPYQVTATSGSITSSAQVQVTNAAVILGTLDFNYDGAPKPVTVTTIPSGLTVDVTYAGSATPPTDPGTYAVVASIRDASYSGSASGSLVITRVPMAVIWTGDTSYNWDTAALNWQSAASVAYVDGDTVSFTDVGTATSAINLAANVQPAAVIVNATKNYTLSGTGALTGTATLTKSGSGTLTLNQTSNAVALIVREGTLRGGGTTAYSNGGFGTGAIELQGGTLNSAMTSSNTLSFGNALTVATGQTGTLNTPNRFSWSGSVTGGGTLNVGVTTTVSRFDFSNNLAGFTGNLNLSGSGGVRLYNNGGSFNTGSFANLALDLAGSVGLLPYTNSSGNTYSIGALSGSSSTAGMGGGNVGGAPTYSIGGLNTSTSFAGIISGNAALTKTGTGTLTLAGANTYTSSTTVNAGKLSVTGSLAATATTVATAGALGGTGTIAGAVTCNGTLAPGVTAGTLTLSNGLVLASTSKLEYDLGSTSDRTAVTGNLTLNGTVNVTAAAGLVSGTYTLLTYTGTLTNNTLDVGTLPAGCTASVSVDTTNKQVNLVVTVASTPTTLTISPPSSTLAVDATATFTATVVDQLGNAVSNPSITWSTSGGTIDADGLFTATTAGGPYQITATSGSLSLTASITVTQAAATVTLGDLTATYDGSAKSASASTTPADLTVDFTYNGSSTVPTAVGTYVVAGTINDANYTGTASATLVIGKATTTLILEDLAATYDGTAQSVTATTAPSGLTVNFTYDGAATAPTNAGTYAVIGTIDDANYTGTASGSLVIGKAAATVTLSDLAATYDGAAKSVTATTVPSGLTVNFTYNGSATAPTHAGTYAVVATVSDANYVGSASGSLVITQASRSFSAWVGEKFSSAQISAGQSAATADPDRDGLTNLAEYALGGDPFAYTPQPAVTANSTSLSITFQRPARTDDVTYRAEASPDFANWTALTLDVLTSGADPETVRATYTYPTPKPGKQFIRLRFEK